MQRFGSITIDIKTFGNSLTFNLSSILKCNLVSAKCLWKWVSRDITKYYDKNDDDDDDDDDNNNNNNKYWNTDPPFLILPSPTSPRKFMCCFRWPFKAQQLLLVHALQEPCTVPTDSTYFVRLLQ